MICCDLNEWIDSISLENDPMIFQEIELSFANLSQGITNISLNEKLHSMTAKNCKTSCQSSPLPIIVKTTKKASNLGRLLCKTNKTYDELCRVWLQKLVFEPPNSSCDFETLPMSLRNNTAKVVRHPISVRPFKRPCVISHFITEKSILNWNDLDKHICRRPRLITDDPYDSNSKKILVKVSKTHKFHLLNGGVTSPLVSVFLSYDLIKSRQ
jgi:hypothetical protein